MNSDELAAWYRSLPGKRLGAGLLIRNAAGDVLVVKPGYKDGWEIPGGLVEPGESPRAAVAREAREELDLDVRPGHLLVVDWSPADGPRTDGLLFIYDGGTLTDAAISAIVLPADELTEFRFVPPTGLIDTFEPAFARRLAAAVDAVHDGATRELEDGHPVG